MSGDIGTPSKPVVFRGQEWRLEVREDDPPDPADDERWLRSDLVESEENQLGVLKCGDGTEIPIFALGTAEETVSEAMRVQIGGEIGYLPIAPVEDAQYRSRRVQHNNEIHAYHNAATPGAAIPDSVVDNFEDVDAEPPGVYEDGETLSDYYTFGSDANYSRTESNVIEGNRAVARDSAGGRESIWSHPGDGLNRYPDQGNTIGFLIRDEGTEPGLIFNVEGTASPGGYGAFIRLSSQNNKIEIRRIDDFALADWDSGGGQLLDSSEATMSIDTWYWGEVTPSWSGNNTIEFDVYQVDETNGELSRGNRIGGVSASDDTYEGERGVGVTSSSSSDTGTVIDWIRILD